MEERTHQDIPMVRGHRLQNWGLDQIPAVPRAQMAPEHKQTPSGPSVGEHRIVIEKRRGQKAVDPELGLERSLQLQSAK